jgi:hypothetical protein
MNLIELRNKARKMGIKNFSKLNKANLELALKQFGKITVYKNENKDLVPLISFDNDELNEKYNLLVKISTIPNAGYGLFAGYKGYKKGDIITEYSRQDIATPLKEAIKEANKTIKLVPDYWKYAFMDEDIIYNPRVAYDLLGRYANDARGRLNNAKFHCKNGNVFIVATRNITPFAEIFCDYGDIYWK